MLSLPDGPDGFVSYDHQLVHKIGCSLISIYAGIRQGHRYDEVQSKDGAQPPLCLW